MIEWLTELWNSISWGNVLIGIGIFLATFFGSLILVALLLVKMPATFFLDSHDRNLWIDQHPVIRWTGIVIKNLAGVLLIILGLVLSLPGIPGQGVLTIIIGVILLDFPGKRKLERKLLSMPKVYNAINRLRARYGKPPLQLDESIPEPPQQEPLEQTSPANVKQTVDNVTENEKKA